MNKVESVLYLFIIWEKSREKTSPIFDDIKKKFIIREVYEITWDRKNFQKNLKRFYGSKVPSLPRKVKSSGTGPFLLILVTDLHPEFRKIQTVNGVNVVNDNTYVSKMMYRKWIGKEFAVHASISEKETNHDAVLLLGKNTQDLEKELPEKWDGSIKKLKSELIGHYGWKNIKQLLYVLNATITYVILRNFEDLPDKLHNKDIDIMAENESIIDIINAGKPELKENLYSLKMKTGDKIFFDFKYLRDHYYDEKWAKDILKRRVLDSNGFYVPCKEDYFYTLLYHVIFHVQKISDKYKKKLCDLAIELNMKEVTEVTFYDFNKSKKFLEKYMSKMRYCYTSSVQYKARNTRFIWFIKVSIFIAKTKGMRFLLTALKKKIEKH